MNHSPEPAPQPQPSSVAEWADTWLPHLEDLAERLRACARLTMAAALQADRLETVSRPLSMGAGDTTFGIDEAVESELSQWLDERAQLAPISLLTEDAGWRHRGPDGSGGVRELDGFDHGGPRLCVDPVDGTRHLMLDLRSAWAVIALAPPGAGTPRQREACAACLMELPDSRARVARRLSARRGAGTRVGEIELATSQLINSRELRVDGDDRMDHGYMPFFAFHPDLRANVAQLAFDFFQRLESEEGAELVHCYDDQYICNAGQLALTAMGTYRMVVDARQAIAQHRGRPAQTTKPYDVAGAILCVQEAGAVVTSLEGAELDFPWDTETPLSFAAFTNQATRERAEPHLLAALAQLRPLSD